MRRLDLTGQRFGKLIAKSISTKKKNRAVWWECSCDCGNDTTVRSADLRSGNTKSCGCGEIEARGQTRSLKIAGQKFGRLTAIKLHEKSPNGRIWECLCDCGSKTFSIAKNLRSGNTQSCGCLQRERISASNRKDISGERFGMLTAIAPSKIERNQVYWTLLCDCGETTTVPTRNLTSGNTISCGCAIGKRGLRAPDVIRRACEYARKRRALKAGSEGSFTEEEIADLFLKQRGRCANCTQKLKKRFHRDHIVSLSAGGSNDIMNIQLLCQPCNNRKYCKDPYLFALENGRLW